MAADPGDQDARRIIGEVIAGKGVDEIDVAGDVGGGNGDDLAVSGRRGLRGGALKQVGRIRREQCSGYQGGHVVTGVSSLDDLSDGGGVADYELMDQSVGFFGHRGSIDAAPDTGLTRGVARTLRW